MPVFVLSDRIEFPPPELSEDDGLLAVGGDLGVERLLKAYSMGIFPWYSEGSPILWWSPDPRLVLFPDELRISRSLRQCIKKGEFRVTINSDFNGVINGCASAARRNQSGTWITGEMINAYNALHVAGHAVSAESWQDNRLAGGLYGVLLGRMFFGESMFSTVGNASKVAFVHLVEHLKERGVVLIDCQVRTDHLISLGAREIPRIDFMRKLSTAIQR